MNDEKIERALNYASGSNGLEENVLTQDEIKIIRDSIIKKESTENFIKRVSKENIEEVNQEDNLGKGMIKSDKTRKRNS